jgi:hypothetical protein
VKFLRALLNESFTLVGLFIAWLVLEGSAKEITGYTIVSVTLIWLLTLTFRNTEE